MSLELNIARGPLVRFWHARPAVSCRWTLGLGLGLNSTLNRSSLRTKVVRDTWCCSGLAKVWPHPATHLQVGWEIC
eukprot:3540418-Alexandrium_andersonii.AAC.1